MSLLPWATWWRDGKVDLDSRGIELPLVWLVAFATVPSVPASWYVVDDFECRRSLPGSLCMPWVAGTRRSTMVHAWRTREAGESFQ